MSLGFIGGFVLGLIVGSALSLVAMAKRGADAIELLAQGAGQWRERAGDLVGQVRHTPAAVGASHAEIDGQAVPASEQEIGAAVDSVTHGTAGTR